MHGIDESTRGLAVDGARVGAGAGPDVAGARAQGPAGAPAPSTPPATRGGPRDEWLYRTLDQLTRSAQVPQVVRAPRPEAPPAEAPPGDVLAWLDGPSADAPPPGWIRTPQGPVRAAATPGFWLLVTRGGWALTRTRFRRPPIVIGRGLDADLRLEDPHASRRHARIEPDGPGWAIHDAGSANGTFVNGERVEERRLRDGDLIDVGAYRLVYRAARPDEVDVLDRGAFEPRPEDYALAARVDPGHGPGGADDAEATPSRPTIVWPPRRGPRALSP